MEKTIILQHIAKSFPHLHDIERSINKIRDETGYGELSFLLKVYKNKVRVGEKIYSITYNYRDE